jgi:CubicO group peptidase (beta-lactamase class C family)
MLSRRAALQAGAASSLAIATPTLARQSATPAPTTEGIPPGTVAGAVDALDGIVADAMDRTGVPGLSVAVVYQDEPLATRGYGVASTETNAPVDADTIFQIASLSKPIASTVIASIVGEEAVTWDTPIVDHLPGFTLHEPWPTSQVTIRDMFCHRSGLADHAGDDLEDMGYDRDEVLRRLRHLRPASSFRSAYAYTNFGLTAAAVAAATATGEAWEDAAAARVYQPAGMTRTSSRFDDFINADNRAAGHVREGDAWVPKYVRDADAQSPAGGVSSTATDMARWVRLQLGGGTLDGEELIPADALAETHRVQVIRTVVADPAVDRAGFYGLGWNVSYDDHGAVQLSHSGAFALGTGTAVYMYPSEDLGIAVLTNGAANGVAESIALAFLDLARLGSVRNDYVPILEPIFAADMVPDYVTDIDYATPPAEALPPQELASYTGTFHNRFYGPIGIAEEGDGLTISQGPAGDPDVYPLTHWSRDTFTYLPIGENENFTSAVTFTIGPDGTASSVTVENLDTLGQGTFTRDEAAAP